MKHEAADKLLLDYLEGLLPDGSRSDFERHLGECEHCRAEVDKIRAVKKASAVLARTELPPKGIDGAILNAARMASARRQANARESAERKSSFSLRFVFRPTAITAFLAVLVIGLTVYYLPDKKMGETSGSDHIALAPVATEKQFEETKDAEAKPDSAAPIAAPAVEAPADSFAKMSDSDERKRNEPGRAGKKEDGPKLRRDGYYNAGNEAELDAKHAKNIISDDAPEAPKAEQNVGAARPAEGGEARSESNVQATPPTQQAPVIALGEAQQQPAPRGMIAPAAPPAPERAKRAQLPQPAAGPSTQQAPQLSATAPPAPIQQNQQTGQTAQTQVPTADALEDRVTEPKKKDAEAASLFAKAKAAEKKGDWDRAAKLYSQLLKKYPNYRRREVLTGLSQCKARLKKTAEAQQYADQLKKEFPAASDANQQAPEHAQ